MKTITDLRVKIFADGADKSGMIEMAAKPFIKGLTTNPTLMRKAGITDYKAFALDVLKNITDKPISLEVFSDDFEEVLLILSSLIMAEEASKSDVPIGTIG